MATITGNEYDHIDINDGTNVTRHALKDTVARADLQDLKSANKYEDAMSTVITNKSLTYQFTQSDWVQGGLGSNGVETVNSKRIRTGYIPVWAVSSLTVTCPDGYRFRVHRFDGEKGLMSPSYNDWATSYTVNSVNSLKYIRIVLRHEPDTTDIATSEYTNCTLTFKTAISNFADSTNDFIDDSNARFLLTNPMTNSANKIADNTDFNTITDNGSYYVSDNANTLTNIPVFNNAKLNGLLYVLQMPSSRRAQIYIAANGKKIAWRVRNDATTWGAWAYVVYSEITDALKTTQDTILNASGTLNTLTSATWVQGGLGTNGAETTGQARIRTNYLSTNNCYGIKLAANDGYQFRVHLYGNNTSWQSHIRYVDWVSEYNLIIPDGACFKVVLRKTNAAANDATKAIATTDATNITIEYYDKKLYSLLPQLTEPAEGNGLIKQTPPTGGIANAIAMSNHIKNIKWTPVAPMPAIHNYDWNSATDPKIITLPAGVEQTGIPYSSTRDVRKYVGSDVSIYTFMSALQNPNSVLYKRVIAVGTLGATYYGCVCDQYASYMMGFVNLPYIKSREMIKQCTEIGVSAIQPGDLLICTVDFDESDIRKGHTVVITGVYKDAYGRIKEVEISEVVNTFPKVTRRKWNDFVAYVNGGASGQGIVPYIVCRYNKVNDILYTPCEFVKGYPDDGIENVVFPDIMPEYGDKATVEAGTDVAINVINAKSYTSIKVYKNDALIDTKAVANFTMSNIAHGTYRFDITDGTNTSSSYLIAGDVHGEYNTETHVVTFSSANCTPYLAESYASSGSQIGMQHKQHFFTAEEIASGSADVSEIIGGEHQCVRVMFINEYGSVKWDSTPLSDQWTSWSAT